jgi:hypothetical protein
MDPNANRSIGRAREADRYWQRRFFALVAGLGVIGLLVWACSGIGGGKPASQSSRSGRVSAAAYGSTAARHLAGGQPGGGAGAASPASSARVGVRGSASPGSPSASPSSGAASSSPRPAASGRSASPAAGGTGKNPARAAAGGGACPAADIVLTLLASKPSYGPRAQPRFQIEVVSTGATGCAFDIGPASLRVVITHGGEIAWNSGACLRDAASRVTRLQRGVPVAVSVVWNRSLTVAGCPATVMAASQRTYVAVAQSGTAQSPGQTFRLK